MSQLDILTYRSAETKLESVNVNCDRPRLIDKRLDFNFWENGTLLPANLLFVQCSIFQEDPENKRMT
jgi:hypothetical protein